MDTTAGVIASDGISVEWAASTHAGLRRPDNEDAVLVSPPIFAVADGMGGHGHGRSAADLALRILADHPWGRSVTAEDLAAAVDHAHREIGALAMDTGGSPGTTLTGAALASADITTGGAPGWLIFNIGDSRTYLHHGGHLQQLTHDHSLQQQLIDGGLTPEAAAARTSRNVITRAIGGGSPTSPRLDVWWYPLTPGQRLVVCSDGLTSEVDDAAIATLLDTHPTAAAAAQALVDGALRAGGRDNVSVLVLDVVADSMLDGLQGHTAELTIDLAAAAHDAAPDRRSTGSPKWASTSSHTPRHRLEVAGTGEGDGTW